MKLEGRITVSRFTNCNDDFPVYIEVEDVKSSVRFLEVRMGLKEFALAVLGLGSITCLLDVGGFELLGTKRENKRELVPCEHPFGDKKKLALAVKALKTFETDGWIGDKKDLENGHNYKPDGIEVRFIRHIQP